LYSNAFKIANSLGKTSVPYYIRKQFIVVLLADLQLEFDGPVKHTKVSWNVGRILVEWSITAYVLTEVQESILSK
jgi:hypothetical protein